MVVKKCNVPEVLYTADELSLARAFYSREKQSLKLSGCRIQENASFSDKSIIPFEGNIYQGDIESLSYCGHKGSGLMAIKVLDETI